VRVAAPDGQIVKGGGRVVKNVAGYDLCKLYTGSLGTLGILAELTFKVLPRPEAWAVGAVAVTPEQTEPLLAAIMDSDLSPAALELFARGADPSGVAPEAGAALLARFEGPEAAVDWQCSELASMATRLGIFTIHCPLAAGPVLWEQVRDWAGGPWVWLAAAGCTGSEVGALLEAGKQAAAATDTGLEMAARAATGSVFYGARGPLMPEAARELTNRLRDAAAARGGTLVVLQAQPPLREGLDVWGPVGPELRLMQGIKEKLDPKGIMNPGRFVGGI
jgi:glycolate oxidase FAD binding subunit